MPQDFGGGNLMKVQTDLLVCPLTHCLGHSLIIYRMMKGSQLLSGMLLKVRVDKINSRENLMN